MIKESTVLVLGAGASAPYKFPLGEDLKLKIIEAAESPTAPLYRRLHGCFPTRSQELKEFGRELRMSGLDSIDAFLENRQEPEYVEFGKVAIALVLMSQESEDALFPRKQFSESWYGYLFQRINPPAGHIRGFANNDLAIVTFNYDRSLEHYLYRAVESNHRSTSKLEERIEVLNALPIIHVHGQIGLLPWQRGANQRERVRSYESDIKPAGIRVASAGINIPHEASGDDGGFERARDCLRGAKQVCFLGFGYHDENLKNLRLRVVPDNAEISGTTKGFNNQKIQADLARRLAARFGSSDFVHHLDMSEADCCTFLERSGVLD